MPGLNLLKLIFPVSTHTIQYIFSWGGRVEWLHGFANYMKALSCSVFNANFCTVLSIFFGHLFFEF